MDRDGVGAAVIKLGCVTTVPLSGIGTRDAPATATRMDPFELNDSDNASRGPPRENVQSGLFGPVGGCVTPKERRKIRPRSRHHGGIRRAKTVFRIIDYSRRVAAGSNRPRVTRRSAMRIINLFSEDSASRAASSRYQIDASELARDSRRIC